MAAPKCNYLVIYESSSQIYGAASEEVALTTPLPDGCSIEDKHIYFIMLEPDSKELVWYKLPDERVRSAELKEKTVRKVADDD